MDDIIYISLLIFSIFFGKYYRRISDIELRKWIGTLIGLLIVFIVSGFHTLHPIVSTLVCSTIIKYGKRSKCHIFCFAFMFSYLFFFRTVDYFGIPLPPGHTNLIQMILTLKLVGLALEINSEYTQSKQDTTEPETINLKEDTMFNELTYLEIFHYSFGYVGVLTGPYFQYKTFYDYFEMPFKEYANCWQATLNKLKWVPFYAAIYLVISYIWPLSYASTTQFYEDRSVLYRLMYVWPSFIIFRMRIYIGITLSECVCTMAGLGAYPVELNSAPGCGPTKEVKSLTKSADGLEYDFETIHNIDVYTTETCWTFREAMKSWNMCVQYWLVVNVHKRFPSKTYRVLATLLVSAVWHGVYSGYYLCIVGAPFYLPIEDVYHKLIRKNATGIKRTIIDILFWISKFFAFSYLGIAFLLLSLDKIWFYYSSIYHIGYIYFAVMYLFGYGLRFLQPKEASKDQSNKTK